MARHFLGLYLLIVATLAAASWGQDRLLQRYGAAPSAPKMEILATADIAGRETLAKLARGEIAYMRAANGESWSLRQLDAGHVIALETSDSETQRGPLDWALTLGFYAAIALVIMVWIWPLRRDLRALEKAAAGYGDRHWRFDADIKPRSGLYPLADTFRKMAARIDGLIASHKDLTNAVSHEIKTPLARMRFEIELAREAPTLEDVRRSMTNLEADIAEINELVTVTLSYAVLERADFALNVGEHDLTALVPAITAAVKRDARPEIEFHCEVQPAATGVACDAHLFETVLKNLLYNASRFARREIRVSFGIADGSNRLCVDDDGPGIPVADRQRVFDSFVQLDAPRGSRSGFGLGLAIVKRAIEWHHGAVSVGEAPLGGARITAEWPVMARSAGPAA